VHSNTWIFLTSSHCTPRNEAERLDERRILAEEHHDLLRDGPVHLEARGQEDRIGAETLRYPAEHGGMLTVAPRLVGRSRHDALPIRRSTHNGWLAAVIRVVPLLDAGVEGV
jgi:hypothetical protein